MGDDPADQSHPATDPARWFLLSGSRIQLSVLLSLAILIILLVVGTMWELEMERLVGETRAVQTLFNTLLGGLILFVSVTLSINIAVLGQELSPLRAKRTRIEDSIEFQAELETFSEAGISPAELGEFFQYMLEALRSEAEALAADTGPVQSASLSEEIRTFAIEVEEEVAAIKAGLGQKRRISTVLLAGLEYDYATHIYTARRLTREVDKQGYPEIESLSNLIEILKIFATGRDHFTTLYFKREVQNFSWNLVVLSLPVVVFTSYVLLAIDAGQFPSYTVLGIQPRLLYVSLAFVISLSPYVLLSAYMLRMITVSKHSLRSGSVRIQESGAPAPEPDDTMNDR